MFTKKYALLLPALLIGFLAQAQQKTQKWCGTVESSPEWLDWYQRHTALFIAPDGGDDTTMLYVPVTLHIVGTDQGTGYFPLDNALRAVCGMNERYTDVHVRFYLKPGDEIRYHNNTSWYEHDWNAGSDMINSVIPGIEDRLNAFIVSDPAGNCGYSWQDAIVLGKGCSDVNNTTWAHEAGHHFSLPHPFRGWEDFNWDYSKAAPKKVGGREVEKIDGSNCYVGGDRFCDTDPDYLNNRWQCNGDGRSITVQHDPDTIAFQSDASLIMGYASDACASRFTEEQIAAIRANLRTSHSQYLNQPLPVREIDDDAQAELLSPVDTTLPVQFNHVVLKWNSVPNAKYYTVEVARNPNFSPRFFYQTLIDSTTVIATKNIPNNMTLYWRVRASNDWDLCQPFDKAQIGVFRTQNLLATNDLERAASFELLPNPVSAGAAARLSIQSDETMDIFLKVCDASGRICLAQDQRLYTGDNQLDINTSGLNAGMYTIIIQNEKGATVKRLAVVE